MVLSAIYDSRVMLLFDFMKDIFAYKKSAYLKCLNEQY